MLIDSAVIHAISDYPAYCHAVHLDITHHDITFLLYFLINWFYKHIDSFSSTTWILSNCECELIAALRTRIMKC